MKKFQKIEKLATALKQSGWENLDKNLTLLTHKSQHEMNTWCQQAFDEILEQITATGNYQPPIEYDFYTCRLKITIAIIRTVG